MIMGNHLQVQFPIKVRLKLVGCGFLTISTRQNMMCPTIDVAGDGDDRA